jgi:hypothetical protein
LDDFVLVRSHFRGRIVHHLGASVGRGSFPALESVLRRFQRRFCVCGRAAGHVVDNFFRGWVLHRQHFFAAALDELSVDVVKRHVKLPLTPSRWIKL